MIINPNDPYILHLPLLSGMDEESKNRLIEDAERVYGSPWGLALKDFFALSEGDLTYIGLEKADYIKASVRQYIWMMSFRECVERVTGLVNAFQVPLSDEAKQANEKCLKMGFKEVTLIFVRKYFGLRSFEEAENTTLSNFIVAKKDAFNNGIFQYAMNEIQRKKFTIR